MDNKDKVWFIFNNISIQYIVLLKFKIIFNLYNIKDRTSVVAYFVKLLFYGFILLSNYIIVYN